MQIKHSDIIALGIIIFLSISGSVVIAENIIWYQSILLPSYVPSGAMIGSIWSMVYLFTFFSIVNIVRSNLSKKVLDRITGLFVINALAHFLWSFLFFRFHLFGASFIDTIIIALTAIGLVGYLWSKARMTAYLMLPYAIWASLVLGASWHLYLMNT